MRLVSIVRHGAMAVLFAVLHATASYVAHPTIDLSQLEQIGLAGPYGGLSMYTDTRQLTQIQPTTASVMSYDDHMFELIVSTAVNGSIQASCQLASTIYIAGHFNINRDLANIAAIDLTARSIQTLGRGLDGPVYSLYCDPTTQSVYAGGNFVAPVADAPYYAESLSRYGGHVAVWSNQTWSALPWKGFNGPVYAITQNSRDRSILFGGKFDSTADGQSNYAPASQQINLAAPSVVSAQNTDQGSNPSNVICGNVSKGTPWILKGQTAGYWEAQFAYSVHPSLFRIGNVHAVDYGTKQFSISSTVTQQPYLLSYLDPLTGQALVCVTNCTLSDDPAIRFQDFRVLNSSLTSGVRINITSWYKNGGGLASVDIFQQEIFVHAVNDYNSPNCSSDATLSSSVKTTGNWKATVDKGGFTKVLSTSFPASQLKSNKDSVDFIPSLPEPGFYDVYLYTPGCTGTACAQRTQVDVTIHLSATNSKRITLNQNNSADKHDIIYSDHINVTAGDAFRPFVTLAVAQSATRSTKSNSKTVTVVASAIQFVKRSSDSSLSSIFDYATQNATWGGLTENVPYQSVVSVMEPAPDGNSIYIGGSFSLTGNSNTTYSNIIRYDTTAKSIVPLAHVGPDGPVSALRMIGSDLYVGGSFAGLKSPNATNQLNNVARYETTANTWHALSGGVNGPVASLLSVQDAKAVLVSGTYTSLLGPSGAPVNASAGNAWWSIGDKAWQSDAPFVSGILYGAYATSVNGRDTAYFAGNVKSAQRFASNGFALVNANMSLAPFPFYPDTTHEFEVRAGVFWNDTNHGNVSTAIVGGTFQLDGSTHNVAMYEGGAWTGIGADWQGQVNTIVEQDNLLYIGGQFMGPNVNNLAIYDLVNKNFTSVPDLHTSDGTDARINMIRYNTADQVMVVGGSFSLAGSLACKGVCTLDPVSRQWNNLGSGVTGEVVDFVFIDNKLVAAGDLQLNDVRVPIALYDYQQNGWSTLPDSDDAKLPGPSQALSYDDQTKKTYIAGQTADANAYLRVWDGQQLTAPAADLGHGSSIRQLNVLPTKMNENMTNLLGNPNTVLLVSGFLNLGDQGNVSAALFNGTHWIPYIVASGTNGVAASFSSIFFKSYTTQVHNTRYLPTPIVILVSIAVALGIVFFIVLLALGVVFLKRRRESRVDPLEQSNNHYSKPKRPESLIKMLNSSSAVTGLYVSEKDPGMDNESTTIINGGGDDGSKVYHEMADLSMPAAAVLPPSKNRTHEAFHAVDRPDSEIRPASETPSAFTPNDRATPLYPSDTSSFAHYQSNNPFRQSSIIGLAVTADQACSDLSNSGGYVARSSTLERPQPTQTHWQMAMPVATSTYHEYKNTTAPTLTPKLDGYQVIHGRVDAPAPTMASHQVRHTNVSLPEPSTYQFSNVPTPHQPTLPMSNPHSPPVAPLPAPMTSMASHPVTMQNTPIVSEPTRLTNIVMPVASTAHTVDVRSTDSSWASANAVYWSTLDDSAMDTAVISYAKPSKDESSESNTQTKQHSDIMKGDVHWQTTPNAKDAMGVATITTSNHNLLDIGGDSEGFASDPDLQRWIRHSDPKTTRWTTAPSVEDAKATAVIVPTDDTRRLRDSQESDAFMGQEYRPELMPLFALNDEKRMSVSPAMFETTSNRAASVELNTSVYTMRLANQSQDKDSVLLSPSDMTAMTVTMAKAPKIMSSFVVFEETNKDKDKSEMPNPTLITPAAESETSTTTTSAVPKTIERALTPDSGLALDGRANSKKMVEEFRSEHRLVEPESAKKREYSPAFLERVDKARANTQGQPTENHPHLYRAKFDFDARDDGELGFEKGEWIIVVDQSDGIWWMGHTYDAKAKDDCKKGVFPSNYVEQA